MFVSCLAGAIVGIRAVPVTVEVNVAGGGIGLFLVGLPDNAVKESEQRIRSAFGNSMFRMTGRKVVVNLAPADLRKEGSGFDLPIAVGILAATEQVNEGALEGTLLVGELSLDRRDALRDEVPVDVPVARMEVDEVHRVHCLVVVVAPLRELPRHRPQGPAVHEYAVLVSRVGLRRQRYANEVAQVL